MFKVLSTQLSILYSSSKSIDSLPSSLTTSHLLFGQALAEIWACLIPNQINIKYPPCIMVALWPGCIGEIWTAIGKISASSNRQSLNSSRPVTVIKLRIHTLSQVDTIWSYKSIVNPYELYTAVATWNNFIRSFVKNSQVDIISLILYQHFFWKQ